MMPCIPTSVAAVLTVSKHIQAVCAATDVGMHGILASHYFVLPPCWFTLRASDRDTLPSIHPSDFR